MGIRTIYTCDLCEKECHHACIAAVRFIWHGSRDEVYLACDNCLPRTPSFFKRFASKFLLSKRTPEAGE